MSGAQNRGLPVDPPNCPHPLSAYKDYSVEKLKQQIKTFEDLEESCELEKERLNCLLKPYENVPEEDLNPEEFAQLLKLRADLKNATTIPIGNVPRILQLKALLKWRLESDTEEDDRISVVSDGSNSTTSTTRNQNTSSSAVYKNVQSFLQQIQEGDDEIFAIELRLLEDLTEKEASKLTKRLELFKQRKVQLEKNYNRAKEDLKGVVKEESNSSGGHDPLLKGAVGNTFFQNNSSPPTEDYIQSRYRRSNPTQELTNALKNVFVSEPPPLPSFCGKPEEWAIFSKEFARTTKDYQIKSSKNITRVSRALKGSAKEAVVGLLDDPDNLEKIMKMLETRFGRSEFVVRALIQKVQDFKSAELHKPSRMVEFGTLVQQMVARVKTLKEDGYLNNKLLLDQIVAKMPLQYAKQWITYLTQNRRKADLLEFADWMEIEVETLVQLYQPVIQEEQKGRRQVRGAGIHVASSEEDKPKTKGCPLCGNKSHRPGKCDLLKGKPLEEYVLENRLCFSCLGKHNKKDCRNQVPCGVNGCEKKHHSSLHGLNLYKKKPNDKNGAVERKLQPAKKEEVPPEDEMPADDEAGIHLLSSKPLSVLPVKITGPKGTRIVYATMDSGANTTVIEEGLANELGLEGKSFTHRVTGVGGIEIVQKARRVSFQIRGDFSQARSYEVNDAVTLKNLSMKPYSLDAEKAKKAFPFLRKAKLHTMDGVTPFLIIGEDNAHLTVHREYLERHEDEPIAKRTKLGWVLAGKRLNGDTSQISIVNYTSEETTDKLETLMKQNWTLDSFGVVVCPNEGSLEDKRALQTLEETSVKVGQRWECGLLWRDPEVHLPESKTNAMKRLTSNEKRMARDKVYGDMYTKKIQEYLQKEFIRELPDCEANQVNPRTWYIPHFGVYNVNKPGKLRLVFDAAAKSNEVSLNDALLPGPDLIRPLMSVLMNFRRHNVVISGDIEDMFHRVLMRKQDQDSQRFLFRDLKSDQVKTYAMQVMIFGACSSPASAIFIKNKNASLYREKHPVAVEAIHDDFYVDDCLSGAVNDDLAIQLREEITQINEEGGFLVKKWTSNSRKVLESVPLSYRAEGAKHLLAKEEVPTERVLGLLWNPAEDIFTFTANLKKIKPELLEGKRPTKREMVSITMSIFDPLGFIANFKIKGLMLLQRTWKAGLDWDDLVPDSIYDDWREFLTTLKEIPNVIISRCYSRDLHCAEDVELHTIVDASEEAYAAVCYLRIVTQGKTKVSFVAAKSRVAPMKKLTIPRMELTAAVMGSRLARTVSVELKLEIGKQYFWSDSKLVLMWIRSETLKYKEFLANRITEIQDITNPGNWYWIPTALNTADQATRFRIPVELCGDSLWLTGPLFLKEEKSSWPKEDRKEKVRDEEDEKRNCVFTVSTSDLDGIVDCRRFSSLTRLLRAQAGVVSAAKFWKNRAFGQPATAPWKLSVALPVRKHGESSERFMSRCTPFLSINLKSQLSASDFEAAEILQMKAVQQESFPTEMKALKSGKVNKDSQVLKLNPKMDKELLCVGGRIRNAEVEERKKYPPILPARHHFTELLILSEHFNNGHQGISTVLNNLRQRDWILEGRAAVQRVCKRCPKCIIWKAVPVVPKMADLPHFRLASNSRPFTFCAVDYFGPMEVVVGRHHEKRWGCLFVCMVTRAIHLEIAYGLSTDEMLLAFTRFIATRGRPRHMYSDNGTNFVGANGELKRMWKEIDWDNVMNRQQFQYIEWHFNPPLSPHHGGSWEIMVRVVKKTMKMLLQQRNPLDQVLLTVIKGVENIVNSRPLTYVSSDPTDPESLTPNHFLRGFSDLGPEVNGKYEARDEFLRVQWKRAQRTLDDFWLRWTKEYLPELQKREKWNKDVRPIEAGDLVVIVDEAQPRNCWMKGLVTATFPGKDGLVRSVEVTTLDKQTGRKCSYRRGVDKICPLGIRVEKFE